MTSDIISATSYLTPTTIDFDNKSTIAKTTDFVSASLGAGTEVITNLTGAVKNAGTLTDSLGIIRVNVGSASATSTFTNSGTVTDGTTYSLGSYNSEMTLTIAAKSTFENTGTLQAIGPASSTNPNSLDVQDAGTFKNTGLIQAHNADLFFNQQGSFTNSGTLFASADSTSSAIIQFYPTSTIANSGVIKAGANSNVSINYGETSTTLTNTGKIEVAGGTMLLGNVSQSGRGETTIAGGTLEESGAFHGGTVDISSGTLAFGVGSRIGFLASPAASEFNASIDFTGKTGALEFHGNNVTREALLPHNRLTVYGTPSAGGAEHMLGTFQLAGGTYTLREFHVSGSELLFTHS